jgi:hypothetical protein
MIKVRFFDTSCSILWHRLLPARLDHSGGRHSLIRPVHWAALQKRIRISFIIILESLQLREMINAM